MTWPTVNGTAVAANRSATFMMCVRRFGEGEGGTGRNLDFRPTFMLSSAKVSRYASPRKHLTRKKLGSTNSQLMRIMLNRFDPFKNCRNNKTVS
jgi:hypothetical protein